VRRAIPTVKARRGWAEARVLRPIRFPVKVEFRLEGVVVRVKQGQIADILSGSVKVKGTLKFSDFVLFERALAPISIPGVLAVTPAQAA
jgi:hypothetical protein